MESSTAQADEKKLANDLATLENEASVSESLSNGASNQKTTLDGIVYIPQPSDDPHDPLV